MLISAMTLAITFIILCFRKRSILAAVMLLVAAEGAAGYLLLTDPKPCKRSEDGEEELFTEEECRRATDHVRYAFGGRRDESADEADFQ